MTRFGFQSLYRSLSRHRLYAALNIGGLAVGIAVFLILSLFVHFETSFEKWLPHHDELYVVQTEWTIPDSPVQGAYANTMPGLLEQMREDFPGLAGTRIRGGERGGSVLQGGVATMEDVAQVDSSFFQLFALPMLSGEGKALADPSATLISRSTARKYFGDANPLGRTMTIAFDEPKLYRVAGVFEDLPANSDLKASILINLPATPPPLAADHWFHWGSTSLRTYLRFPTPEAASAFQQRMPGFVNRRGAADLGPRPGEVMAISLLPLTRAHLQPQGQESASRKLTVAALGIVGLLTLLIAIVNYVNLATARAGLRAREVAMRKVLGADRAALIRQFLGEAVLTVGMAAFLGLILAELGLPLVNAAGGLTLSLPYAVVVPALVLLALVVGVAAGFYPALMLSRFPAASVLASARSPGGGRAGTRARELLVVLQFGLAIAFIIGTLVLSAQTRHVRTSDLGFRRDGLLVVQSLADSGITEAHARQIITALRTLPGVEAVGVSDTAAGGGGSNNTDSVAIPGRPGSGPSLRRLTIGPGFFEAYAPRLVAGRLFDDAHGADNFTGWRDGQPRNIVINRKAVGTLGFASPEAAIGKTVGGKQPRTIVGVIDELRFFTPRLPDDPTYYIYYRDSPGESFATLRYRGDRQAMEQAVGDLWRRMAPQVPLNARTADSLFDEFYQADDRATRLFAIGSGLAVLIGCVGLWGLASFNTQRRVKEIGIRKTLGASSTDVAKLLVGQFLRPVLIANLVAWPLAFVAMRAWLAGFDDRVALSPLFFMAATVVATLIAVLTVLAQSLRASRAAPSWALRHE